MGRPAAAARASSTSPRSAAVAGFAQAHGQQLRGHTLVWHQDMPHWLLDGLAEGPARARALLTAHLDAVLPATRPAIRDWDVVNEAVANADGNPFTATGAGDRRPAGHALAAGAGPRLHRDRLPPGA